MHKKPLQNIMLIGIVLCVSPWIPSVYGEMTPFDWAMIHLDYTRQEKVEQLRTFCERIHGLAQKSSP